METLMQKRSNFRLTESEMNALVTQGIHVLESSGTNYNPTTYGVKSVMSAWQYAKGWMVDLFKRSPNYVEGKYMIKLTETDLQRPTNAEAINQCANWFRRQLIRLWRKYEIKFGFFTYEEYVRMMHLCDNNKVMALIRQDKTYHGHTAQEWKEDYCRIRNNIKRAIETIDPCYIDGDYRVSLKNYERYNAIDDIFRGMLNAPGNEIDDETVLYINELVEKAGIKSKVSKGGKWTKYIGKLCRELGIDKIVDIQEEHHVVNGEWVTRKADKGYNYYRALLGDSINPLHYKATLILSCNPIDYWTMSYGGTWASCHTIDKNGRRRGSNFSGCYSAGTQGYMSDDASFIVYTLYDDEWYRSHCEATLPDEEKSKMQRCVFIMGEDKLIENRIYPDDRDGGDKGLNAQFRNIVQKVIADLYETPNYWELRKGISACAEVTKTVYAEGQDWSFHYEDYTEYDNGSVSYLRRINGNLNHNIIEVGSSEIVCPSCGSWHSDDHEWITCCDCRYATKCERCGNAIDTDYDDYIFIDGRDIYFCCSECAERAGYVWCEDVEEWKDSDYCRYDDYCNAWYYDDSEGVDVGDYWYHNEETAINAGYVYCEYDDEWEHEKYVMEFGETGEYFSAEINDDYIVTVDGLYFPDRACAEGNGYHENADGEWTDEEETEEAV